MAHAELSPSAASRWLRCQGSVVLSKDIPNTSSEFAAEGSVAHEVGYLCLFEGRNADYYLGHVFEHDGFRFTVGEDMVTHVQTYIDYVRGIHGHPLYEQRLPIMHITGEQDAHGTADAIIIADRTLHIVDLKYGMGVKVFAAENEQLMIYALAALHQYEMVAEFGTITLHIVQPRLDHIDTWEVSIEELMEFKAEVAEAARWVAEAKVQLEDKHFVPGYKQCKFCPAKPNCRAWAEQNTAAVWDDFVDLTKPLPTLAERTLDNAMLGNLMQALPMIEDFCKTIRSRAESELLQGNDVPGFKLVEGRRGARKWTDDDAAIAALGELAWEQSLISPTTAEKLLKKDKLWEAVQPLITQSPGKPSVAPADDKRPALSLAATPADFED